MDDEYFAKHVVDCLLAVNRSSAYDTYLDDLFRQVALDAQREQAVNRAAFDKAAVELARMIQTKLTVAGVWDEKAREVLKLAEAVKP